VSLENWSSPRNHVQLRSESPASLPRVATVLLGVESSANRARDLQRETRGQLLVQRCYTEDWVLRRGYQQHRRTASSWYSEFSQDPEEDKERVGGHYRNISNAKTITPADYHLSGRTFLSVPGTDLSSDRESAVSGATGVTGRYTTAPQSLADFPMDRTTNCPEVPALPSRWADLTPSSVEDKDVNGLKGLSLPLQKEPTPTQTSPTIGSASAIAGCLLSAPKSGTTSRASTPISRKSIKWRGRNVIVQLPPDAAFGLPDGRPMPLSREEVEEKMKGLVDGGYDLSIGGQGACKESFPEERRDKVEASEVFVSIPEPRGMFIRPSTANVDLGYRSYC